MICIDDFGLSKHINLSIIHLIKIKKVDLVTIICTPKTIECISEHSKILKSVKLGLHITLTNNDLFSKELSNQSQWKYWFSVINTSSLLIEEEIFKQYHEFLKIFNRPPDYIDGHQFIHQSPIVSKALIKVLIKLNNKQAFKIRVFTQPPSYREKVLYSEPLKFISESIKIFFGNILKRKLSKIDIKTNRNLFSISSENISKYHQELNLVRKYYDKNKDIIYFHTSTTNSIKNKHEFMNCRENDYNFLLHS